MSASFSAVAGRTSARGASARARRSASASSSAVRTSWTRCCSVSSAPPRASVRSARSTEDRTASHGRAGPAIALRSRSSLQQRRPLPAVGVGDEQEYPPLEPGQVLGRLQGFRGQRPEQRTDVRLGHHHGGERVRRLPARPLRSGEDRLRRRALDQVGRQPLQQPLTDPAGGVELVGVPRHARRRQLVDVGEDQLGEAGQGVGVDLVAHRGGRHLAPGDPSTDPVRREQRVDGSPTSGLTAAELVGTLDRRRGRGARVGAPAARRQRDEPAESELNGGPDVLAHRTGQRAGVARDLVGDRRDRLLGHLREARCASPRWSRG